MSIAALQNQLSTPSGFAAAVKAPKGLLSGAFISLIAAAVGIGMNLFQLGSASNWNWSLIERYFLSADAIEFTGARSGRAEIWRYVYVWGPVVLIPLAIILFIVYFATKSGSGAKLFTAFQERGWVGRQRSLGINALNGNRAVALALVGPADAPDGYVDQPALQFGSWAASLDKKAAKALTATATKAGALQGAPAQAIHENLPADMIVTTEQKGGELVIVIPPAGGATKGYKVLMIKGQPA